MPAEPAHPGTADRADAPQPSWAAPPAGPTLGLGLRQMMLLLPYCAVVSLAARPVIRGTDPAAPAVLALVVGGGLAALGLWLAARLVRLALLGWVVFVLGFLVATAATMGPLAILIVPVLVGVMIFVQARRTAEQQDGLLWVLAVAADRRIPLAPGVEAFAQQARGAFRLRAHALAVHLQGGRSLAEAARWVPQAVPREAPILIRMGEQAGRPAEALRAGVEARSRRHESLGDAFGRLAYLGLVVAAAEGVVGFACFSINPHIRAVLNDFAIDLPGPTRRLFDATEQYGPVLLGLLGVQAAVLIYLGIMLAAWGWREVPILGRLARAQHRSLIFQSLALVVEAGGPLDRAFATLAAEYPSGSVRRRLRRAAATIRSGVDWGTALEFARLIRPGEAAVLDAATRAGNLPWALRTMALAAERRFAYRLQVGSHLAFVAAILALGLLVLGLAMALFAPLLAMIRRFA